MGHQTDGARRSSSSRNRFLLSPMPAAKDSETFLKCRLHKCLLRNESAGTRNRKSRVSEMTPEDSCTDNQRGTGGGETYLIFKTSQNPEVALKLSCWINGIKKQLEKQTNKDRPFGERCIFSTFFPGPVTQHSLLQAPPVAA